MDKILSKLLMAFGVVSLLLALFFYSQTQSPNRLAFEGYTEGELNQTSEPTKRNEPRYLVLESLDKVLPIYQTELRDNRWQTTERGVSYLIGSGSPGNTGNAIMYGHNWKSLLGDLHKVAPGDMIVLSMDDGAALRYGVEYIQVVEPTDTAILNQSEDVRLTLYTCTGFLDSKRLVVTAILRS